MPEITVIQDTREKRPLLFPKTVSLYGRLHQVIVLKRRMDAGDYCLLGLAGVCLIERKGSLNEIRQNFLTVDKHRMKRALDRLCAATGHPVLLLEASPADLLVPTKDIPEPGPILQHLLDECTRRRIEFLFPGKCTFAAKRRMVGELVLRFLVSYAREAGKL